MKSTAWSMWSRVGRSLGPRAVGDEHRVALAAPLRESEDHLHQAASECLREVEDPQRRTVRDEFVRRRDEPQVVLGEDRKSTLVAPQQPLVAPQHTYDSIHTEVPRP